MKCILYVLYTIAQPRNTRKTIKPSPFSFNVYDEV